MPNRRPVIVIDPGHGGREKIGGSSPNNAAGANGLLEKNLTLDIALRMASVLTDSARVLLTRNDDVNLSLSERANLARRNDAAIFLSLHFNGLKDRNVDGAEVFVASRAGASSERLARLVLDHLVTVTSGANRGVKRADLGVLLPDRHLPQTAACLAEIAFLTNPAQAKNLEDAAYRQRIAAALGDAILKSLSSSSFSLQSLPFEYKNGHSNSRYFQPPDYYALGGEPKFDIKESVGKGGANKPDDIFAVKQRLIELGFDWITPDKKLDQTTIAAIKLFQSIVNGDNSIKGDGKIETGKNTYLWLQAVNAPRWQTMPAGSNAEGFFNFELSDKTDKHDFGADWLADTIKSAAAHYRDNYLKKNTGAALLTVNDVSLEHGGDTPDHSGHEAGLACDLQLPRTDGKAGFINYSNKLYDRNAARGVLQALKAQPLVSRIYFNDPVLAKEGLCQTEDSWCAKAKEKCHDNHIHFEIKPPARGAVETDGMGYYRSGGKLYQGSRQDDMDYQAHALDAACGNSKEIAADEVWRIFKPMLAQTQPGHGKNYDFNACLRWNKIPKNACEIDVVVHFHGFNRPDFATLCRVTSLSGLNFSDPAGNNLAKRVAPTLCILPLGKSEPSTKRSDRHVFPFFNSDTGLQDLINDSLEFLAADNKLPKGTFKLKRLILTAHSGGGTAIKDILSRRNKKTLKLPNSKDISEIHLFDATYDGSAEVIQWLQERVKNDTAFAKSKSDMQTKGGALRVLDRKSTRL